MKKFQFLCSNHRQWLSNNPEAAINTCLRAYNNSLDLTEEQNFAEAINYAGAAFESSELVLDRDAPLTSVDIHRFADSGVLLVQLLYRVKEVKFASAVLAWAIARFERLLILGVERKTVLSNCQRLLDIGENLSIGIVGSDEQDFSAMASGKLH